MAEIETKQLKQIPLFSRLKRDDLKAVAKLFQRADYPAGSQICRQGQLGRTAYLVVSGELRILWVNATGIEQEVGRIGPGTFFGETSLLLGEPRDVTVETTRPTTLLYLEKKDFDLLLRARPALLNALQMRPDVARKRRAPRFKWQDDDEVVIVHLHKHEITLIRQLIFPGLLAIIGLVGIGYGIIMGFDAIVPLILLILGAVLTLAASLMIVYMVVDHRNDYYIVTSKRVVHEERVPLLRESRTEAPLYTIQDVQELREGLLAQWFGFGDLIIETAGERGHVVFRQIPDLEETRAAIFEQVRRVQAGARAEERAAIRAEIERRFGLRPADETAAQPQVASPEQAASKETGRLWRFFFPALRYESGDTITWRKHWIALFKPIWLPTLIIVLITTAAVLVLAYDFDHLWPVLVLYGVAMAGLVPWWLWRFDDWQNDLYQVTSTRIINVQRSPFYLREERREASLDKVQNISLEVQGFLGKLLNFGTVTIETAGAASFVFQNVKDPHAVQTEIARRVQAFQRQLRQQETERHRAELLDWFSVYDQVHRLASHDRPLPAGEET